MIGGVIDLRLAKSSLGDFGIESWLTSGYKLFIYFGFDLLALVLMLNIFFLFSGFLLVFLRLDALYSVLV